MKKRTLIILAVALAATAANADDYYFCWTADYGGPHLFFGKIPGPGTHNSIDIVHQIPIPSDSDAITYDGENWWINVGNDIYCFDQNGDYVRSFPNPGTGSVVGLGWDSQYLWICSGFTNYQRDIYGNPGPYSPFDNNGRAVTIVGDRLLCGDEMGGLPAWSYIWVFDFDGNHLFCGAMNYGHSACGFISLAYHDGIVWATSWYDDSDWYVYHDIVGYYYDDDGDWSTYATVNNVGTNDLAVCDADFINIAEASMGQIKAYFAEEEGGK